jgi:uncharacterized protein involved in exopolysaccharide biosynthesis
MLTRTDANHATLDDSEDLERGPRAVRGSGGQLMGMSDLRDLWMVLRWRASLIGLVALATIVVACVALLVVTPKYKATTILLVDPRQPRVTQAEVIAGIGADAAAVESQVELIESSAVARKAIARLSLDKDPDFARPSMLERVTEGLRGMFGEQPVDRADWEISRLVYKFQQGMSVRRRGLTYVLEISYSSVDPAKAARLSGAIAEAYLEDQRLAKSEITVRASNWLIDRIEEMRARVRVSEQAVAAYKSANNIVDVTQGNRLVSRQVEDLTQQLALQRSRVADARARLERIQQGTNRISDPAALSESLQSTVIANLRTQYTEAARLEAEYSALYGSRYPGLIAIRAQLGDIKKQIEAEIARILIAVRNEYQVAASHEGSLEAGLARLKEQSGQYNEANVKLQELEREAHANRQLFEQFLNRAKETTEQQSLQIADARIISPALIPLKPDRPPTVLLLLVAAGCGAVLGLGLVLALERMRRGFRTAEEVERATSIPTLGILPSNEAVAKGMRAAARPPAGASGKEQLASHRSDAQGAYAVGLRSIRARLAARRGQDDLRARLCARSRFRGLSNSSYRRRHPYSLAVPRLWTVRGRPVGSRRGRDDLVLSNEEGAAKRVAHPRCAQSVEDRRPALGDRRQAPGGPAAGVPQAFRPDRHRQSGSAADHGGRAVPGMRRPGAPDRGMGAYRRSGGHPGIGASGRNRREDRRRGVEQGCHAVASVLRQRHVFQCVQSAGHHSACAGGRQHIGHQEGELTSATVGRRSR